jgi:hypothetical protein
MTQTIKASTLGDLRQYGPIFIDDAAPQQGLDGQFANFARRVVGIADHFGSSLGGREQITVEFADGTPGRVFDLNDDVVVYNILPGTDLTAP